MRAKLTEIGVGLFILLLVFTLLIAVTGCVSDENHRAVVSTQTVTNTPLTGEKFPIAKVQSLFWEPLKDGQVQMIQVVSTQECFLIVGAYQTVAVTPATCPELPKGRK